VIGGLRTGVAHHDAGVADVRAFFVGAGPDHLDLVDGSLPGGGLLGQRFQGHAESTGREAQRLK